jgi:hypothetical protein
LQYKSKSKGFDFVLASLEAEECFKSAQKMAADSSVPAEVRELGRVIQRVMLGDTNVDLSSLPREWAEAVRRAVHE